MLGFIFVARMTPSPSLAWDRSSVENAAENLAFADFLAAVVEESSYHASLLIPGAEWFNQYIEAPIAFAGTLGCTAGAALCESCGWHIKGWLWMSGSPYFSSYLVGVHKAHPTSLIIAASTSAARASRRGAFAEP